MRNVRIEGSYTKGVQYLRNADQLLHRLREMLRAGGVQSGGLHANFDVGVYAYARIGPGIEVVNIVADHDTDETVVTEEQLAFERITSPDFLCGVVYRGYITQDEEERDVLNEFRPDQRTGLLFGIGIERQTSRRLGVRPFPSIDLGQQLSLGPGGALAPPSPNRPVYSQYTVLRPGFYSGTMKKLVQLLMGYGKLNPKSIYGSAVRPITDPNAFYYETDFQKEVAESGTQIRYDWRFHRTHGLARAIDGKWWLVQIRPGYGVHAMPLSLYDSTTAPAFREKAEELGDSAALDVLDLFGGLPTGEGFPVNAAEFDAMVRAGYIVRGLDPELLVPFYNCNPYSAWHGWAFSASGARADNTAVSYDPDGYQTGVHYQIAMSIGEIEEGLSPSLRPSQGSLAILKRLVILAGSGQDPPQDFRYKVRAALLKVDRLTIEQADEFLMMPAASAFSAIDALDLAPIVEFSASIRLVSSSRIYQPYKFGPQFSYYDPDVNALLSHDGRGEDNNPSRPTRTDATMHVFYVGENLHWVKLFCRVGFISARTEDEGELTCGLVGSRTITTTFGLDEAANGVYTETYDDRATAFSSQNVLKINGTRLGAVLVGFADSPLNLQICSLFRSWRFKVETSLTEITEGSLTSSSAAVPYGCRESYYYAAKAYSPGSFTYSSASFPEVQDPYTYTGWRNLFSGPNAQHPAGCGNVRNRHVWQEFYFPSEDGCSDLVDSGPWAQVCEQIEPKEFNIPAPVVEPTISRTEPSARFKVVWVGESPLSPLVTVDESVGPDQAGEIGGEWFVRSPDDDGNFQYLAAQKNELGTGSTLKCYLSLNQPGYIGGSPRFDDMPNQSFTFIGVVDG